MKTKMLIPVALAAAGMLATPFALAQQEQMPTQDQMPKQGMKHQHSGSTKSSGSMSSSPSSSGSTPMGAASPYTVQKWNKGDKLPTEFRDRQYVIDKYKEYNLPAPKKGYHWVGIGADYYQVSSNGTVYSVGPGG
jgi:Ni/Co efflux regulator RcnB